MRYSGTKNEVIELIVTVSLFAGFTAAIYFLHSASRIA